MLFLKVVMNFTGFSMVSDSQGPTDFSAQLGFSEDSNSQSSEPSTKRLKTDWLVSTAGDSPF
jgi:hypothetical protein